MVLRLSELSDAFTKASASAKSANLNSRCSAPSTSVQPSGALIRISMTR